MREIWMDIRGFEGLYQVSNKGRVLSTGTSRAPEGTGNYNRERKFLKQYTNNKGYMMVHLYKRGKDFQKLVHRLVAEAFIPNDKKFKIVNHKDENPKNNNVSNLEWCTQKYNMNYGSAPRRIGIANGRAVVQKDKDGNVINVFDSAKEAQRKLGISNGCINECCQKKRKTAGGYVWDFVK